MGAALKDHQEQDHTFLMRASWVVGFVVLSSGCFTDIRDTPSDDDDGTSSAGSDDSTSAATDPDDTRGPDSASGSDPRASTTDPDPSTDGGSTDEGSTGGTSGGVDTDDPDTTDTPKPPSSWPAHCIFDADTLPPCGTDPLAVTEAGGDGCELTAFANDGADFCSLPEFAETNLQSPAGQHVIGLLGVFGALSLVGQNPEQAPLDCAQAWGSFTTTPADTAGLAVRVRANNIQVAPIVVRPIDGLCDIAPSGDNCCTGAGANPASAACGDDGLRACVVGFDPYCDETAWDDLCVATAVLQCGANCLDLAR